MPSDKPEGDHQPGFMYPLGSTSTKMVLRGETLELECIAKGLYVCTQLCNKRKAAETALKSTIVFLFASMTGQLQISPGRRMEESCPAVEYPSRTSRKHSRSPMWWKATRETTAARPQTGWAPHTTSLKSPSKVRRHSGVWKAQNLLGWK